MSKNLSELSRRKGMERNLFEALSEPDVKGHQLANEFLIGSANVRGSTSFYDFLKPENQGKKVYVCNGTACLCAGTQPNLIKQLKTHFPPEDIGHMTCLGHCHENSSFYYQGNTYSALGDEQLSDLFAQTAEISATHEHQDDYAVSAIGPAVLTASELSLGEVELLFNRLLSAEPNDSLKHIEQSGLRGRGGAGFPMGFKLRSARDTTAPEKYLICNADEGDPGAYSDRFLLEQRPHMVLFGMAAAAYLMGARWGILYIRGEYPKAIKIIQEVIDQWSATDWFNSFVRSTGFQFKVVSAQGAYICGEETALINSLEGQRPEVRVRPPFPTQQGLFNQPTVVNNVETLASLYVIINKGGEYYSHIGTADSSGTKLLSLDSAFNRPGIYEVPMGTPLNDVFEHLGKGFKQSIKAVQIGGPLGGIIPMSKCQLLTVDFESFAAHGFLLGHASVVCIPSDFSMIDYLHHLMKFAADESCGKCFPCRLGTRRAEELLSAAMNDGVPIDVSLFDDLLTTLTDASLCAHGGGIPLPVRNALEYFKAELKPHFTGGES